MESKQQIIITGGEGSLAKAIAQKFHHHHLHTPNRTTLNVCHTENIHHYFSTHPCDLLICNAGIIQDALLIKTTETTWQKILDTNLKGAALCAAAAARNMTPKKSGHIIFISSRSAVHPPIGQAAYAAAKAGLIGLTKSLAKELGTANIRVNCILPGFLENRMTYPLPPKIKSAALAEHTLAHFNTESSVAEFLHTLHHHMPHTSGQVFQLDSRINSH